MKRHITNFIKNKLKFKIKQPIIEEVKPNFCLIDGIGTRDFILTTWVNKNNNWTMVMQTQRDGVLVTKFNHHDVSNRRTEQLGIRFKFLPNKEEIVQLRDNDEVTAFVTSTTFILL